MDGKSHKKYYVVLVITMSKNVMIIKMISLPLSHAPLFVTWGHSFGTYAQRGVKQKRTPCVQGGGGLHVEVRTQKRPFLHVFCDIFICWKILPCFVVFGVDFHYRFIKHLL